MVELNFQERHCPACGHHINVPFFDGGRQPLATLGWPRSEAEARHMPRFPLDFVRCVSCGHVFNATFDYEHVPYSSKPNLMFNRALNWSRFLEKVQVDILSRLGEGPTVVEVGHGDGSFLSALSRLRSGGRYIGFDPHGATDDGGNVEFHRELFEPSRHLEALKPDLLISRHVLEHLVNPLGFLQGVSFAAACLDIAPVAYFEVPCIDNAIINRRTVDFYYEHSSQFTTNSFVCMLARASTEILDIGHGYGGEVVYGFVRIGTPSSAKDFAKDSYAFLAHAKSTHETIIGQLAELSRNGTRVAIWGGTGKSAAFMCRYGVDAQRFPLVVDSDQEKVGTFVPGTGQEIRSRDLLRNYDVEVVIIPPQWRAADIVAEMKNANIVVAKVLVEHMGRLVEFP